MTKRLTAVAVLATGVLTIAAPAAAATLTPGAPGTTMIDLADDFAALGLTVGVVGEASMTDRDGVFVLPVTSVLPGATADGLLPTGPAGDAFAHQGSGLSLTTSGGVKASLTDLIMDAEDGVVSGLVTVDGYLPDGQVLYGRMDLFAINDAEGDMTFDMVVAGMAGETLLTYLGVDLGDKAFAEADLSAALETPVPGALALFATALAGGALARRRAAH